MGKASEKLTKTIEDQGEKQVKAIKEHGKQLSKSSSEKEFTTYLRQKQVFDEVSNENIDEIGNLVLIIQFIINL